MKENHCQYNSNECYAIVLGIIIAIYTYIISKFYVYGDQINYHEVYSMIGGVELKFGFKIYQHYISTTEMVHYFIIYLASNFDIEKNLFFAFINGIFAAYASRLMSIWNVNFAIISLILISNFYVLVMYFSAERLKIGFVFLILSLLCTNKPILRPMMMGTAILSHYSLIVFVIGSIFNKFFDKEITNKKQFGCHVIKTSIPFILCVSLVYYENEYIFWKLKQYISSSNVTLFSGLPITALFLLSIYYAGNIRKPLLQFLPLIVIFLFLGGSRVNMLAYFMFLYYALQVNRGINWGVIISSLFLIFKSHIYFTNIYFTGQGF